jgi:hypothetical protein
VNLHNGLVTDTSRDNSPVSIAVVGFALSSYPVAVERGWIEHTDAAQRCLAAMRFFSNSDQSGSPNATGFKGFYYHFLDIRTGVRVWQSELSMIDTALLVAGVLMTSMYFTAETADEVELRELADFLYRRIDWQWAQSDSATRFGKAGNLNADFCTTDGRATAKPSCFTCLPWVPPPTPDRRRLLQGMDRNRPVGKAVRPRQSLCGAAIRASFLARMD